MLHEYLSYFFLILGGLFYAKSHWTLSARKDWIFSFSFLISLDFLGGFYDSTRQIDDMHDQNFHIN